MKSVNYHTKVCTKTLRKCIWLIVLTTIMFGCQKNDASSSNSELELVREMKSWFETLDFEASGYANLQEGLEGIFQDEGYTVSLYDELAELQNQTGASRVSSGPTLQKCQEWFELIDYQASGYRSLEEAIKHIYVDDGSTLALYKKLVKRNTATG